MKLPHPLTAALRATIGPCTALLVAACSKPANESAPVPAAPPTPSPLTRPEASKGAPAPSALHKEAPPDACAQMCSTMLTLQCPNDPPNCAAHCAEMANIPECKSEMAAFIACVARQGPSASRCNEDGEAEIRDGFCDNEQARVAQCLEKAS